MPEGLTGIVVHDNWPTCHGLDGVGHGLCNAHHLREPKALTDIEREAWASGMARICLTQGRWPMTPEGGIRVP